MRLDPLTHTVVMLVAFSTSVAAALFGVEVIVQLYFWLG
jgi:hypothetical protein